jgi:predicted RNA polymerase sigma factor
MSAPPPPDGGSPAPDPVMARLVEAGALVVSEGPAAARERYESIWAEVGPDGDPLHVVTLAHQLADLQPDPQAALDWDLRALAAAERLTDERARRHHESLRVAGFRPSLHLNVADDLARLGRTEEARAHLDRAEDFLAALPDAGYGTMIRGGVARLRSTLDAPG